MIRPFAELIGMTQACWLIVEMNFRPDKAWEIASSFNQQECRRRTRSSLIADADSPRDLENVGSDWCRSRDSNPRALADGGF